MEGAQSALRQRLQCRGGHQGVSKAENGAANGAEKGRPKGVANGPPKGPPDGGAGEVSSPQEKNTLIKATLFVVLIVHTLLIYLTIKTMKLEKINHKLKEESIIFMTEIMKLIISSFFYFHENKFNLTSVRDNITEILTKKKSYVVSLTIPSIMYYFQNIFFYISMSSIPIPLFQLLYQFRILVVVIFTYILLKRRIKISQLISIVFLFLSLVCLKDYNLGNGTHRRGKPIDEDSRGGPIDTHTKQTWNVLPLKDNHVEDLGGILLYNLKKKSLNKNTRFDFSTLYRVLKKRKVFLNRLNKNSCHHPLSDPDLEKNYYDIVSSSRRISTDGVQSDVEACKVRTTTRDDTPPYGHQPQDEYTPHNMVKPEKTTRNKIIIGILATFLATFTSGFSTVFLELLYLNYRYSFWFQNMCLAFFTIILSLSTSHLDISSVFRRFAQGGEAPREDVMNENAAREEVMKEYTAREEAVKENAAREEVIKENAAREEVIKENAANPKQHRPMGAPRDGEEQPDDGPPPNGVTLFFSNHFNSVKEFLYVALLIILNSIGGIITSVFIKHRSTRTGAGPCTPRLSYLVPDEDPYL
ncbi:hypothetical protein PCYB_103630 [Plasmodium cynomolgi strain B]|uniref:UDP-N-acetyl glucosamine:UMP antiporter n=1 Tax=Plasmodium cynomolgi (strain B) TaxID=1120755 RepID=K6UKQ3_PLACD|nr:hypothetical protein PCYB_103630 [Plasmodium cynomolgi strain B]GAB67013.1 hypothetical protein PCYB_103630 [Plasmodium cynomolgi strain B]